MPAYFDNEKKTWYAKFYYTDWTGTKKQKMKRGFKLQREAKEWERDFLEKQQRNPDISFQNLFDNYMEDQSARLRETTLANKKYLYESHILPYFKNKAISNILPVDVRKWQNELLSKTDSSGKTYSQTYIKTINNQLVACLNYACKYYGLKENPCHKAGSIGKKSADEMQFWTLDEFNTFIKTIDDPCFRAAFMALYYTGARIGELFALTPADIDKEACAISINKSLAVVDGKTIISEPKTPKSTRTIMVPPALIEELQGFINMNYDLRPTDRVFSITKAALTRMMQKHSTLAGVKKIRLHDLRHSHASLLIELGFSPLLIANRLGHEKIETTLNTYSHLYPSKESEVTEKLQNIILVSKQYQ